MKPTHISIIRWWDQHYTYGPLTRDELLNECIGTTTGFFIKENKTYIAVSSEWFEWTDSLRHVIHIPKCAIISHKKIKVK